MAEAGDSTKWGKSIEKKIKRGKSIKEKGKKREKGGEEEDRVRQKCPAKLKTAVK